MKTNQLSLEELQNVISAVLTPETIARGYQATYNEITKCLQKIGAQIEIKGKFPDRLEELDGRFLPRGKIIEEYYKDLPKVMDYDKEGKNTLKRQDPHYRPAYYSYPIPRKMIKCTRGYNEYEAACIDSETLAVWVSSIVMDIENSFRTLKYGLKRQLIGSYIKKVISAMGDGSQTFATSTAYDEGSFVNDGTDYGVVVEKIEADNEEDFATLVNGGQIVVLKMIKEIAKPVDTETGEAFLKTVMDDIEIAEDLSNGYCLNGGAVGAVDNLKLYILKGIKSSLKVDTMAGAFHREDLELGVEMKDLPDFGDAPSDVFAVLTDPRTFALWQSYEAMREQNNGEGDFINFFKHSDFTPFASRNTFFRLYKMPNA